MLRQTPRSIVWTAPGPRALRYGPTSPTVRSRALTDPIRAHGIRARALAYGPTYEPLGPTAEDEVEVDDVEDDEVKGVEDDDVENDDVEEDDRSQDRDHFV